MPFLSELEPDDAGIDPAEVSRLYGLAVDKILMMSRNENPYGPSPKVWEALRGVQLHRYPDFKAVFGCTIRLHRLSRGEHSGRSRNG